MHGIAYLKISSSACLCLRVCGCARGMCICHCARVRISSPLATSLGVSPPATVVSLLYFWCDHAGDELQASFFFSPSLGKESRCCAAPHKTVCHRVMPRSYAWEQCSDVPCVDMALMVADCSGVLQPVVRESECLHAFPLVKE
uniref:T. congolense-specific, cell surface-expressed gene family n=1 Tax=Trypanosoma congolense (strain IL3000) TaxID=1068625 RepID=G0URA1_TRYCI|nr:hypothetical protein, unlikely [Trypanosoma congolense IL3000]